MNWSAAAAIGSLLAVLAVIIGWGFTHGQLTQTVKDVKEDVSDLKQTTKAHADTLVVHGEKIGRLQEWKDGFSAGARLGKPE
jgi:hypothetical protein